MTLDDGEQRLVNGQERSLVDGWAQVVEGQQLERSQDQYDVVRVGDEPLPLAQQWGHRRHRGNGEGKGQRGVLTGRFDQEL